MNIILFRLSSFKTLLSSDSTARAVSVIVSFSSVNSQSRFMLIDVLYLSNHTNSKSTSLASLIIMNQLFQIRQVCSHLELSDYQKNAFILAYRDIDFIRFTK